MSLNSYIPGHFPTVMYKQSAEFLSSAKERMDNSYSTELIYGCFIFYCIFC